MCHNQTIENHSLVCVLCDLYLSRSSVALRAAGHVDCVAKETVARHSTTNYPSHHRTTVDTNPHLGERERERESPLE